LESNTDKKFVKRILNPEKYGRLDNKDGSHSTHSMAWGSVDGGKYMVFPTVVTINGKLKRLKGKEAFKYAVKNKEGIIFDDKKEAAWFSKNYKSVWKK
jgi:hypothetical protein